MRFGNYMCGLILSPFGSSNVRTVATGTLATDIYIYIAVFFTKFQKLQAG